MKICTLTGRGFWDGGTDGDVHVSLVGDYGCVSPWVNLDNSGNDFEKGSYDCFEYHTEAVGSTVVSHVYAVFGIVHASWGDAWCNGQHVCFPSMSLMLECGFESGLGLEFSCFSVWQFLKLVVGGFLWVLRFPPLLHRLMVSANRNKAKMKSISTLSNLITGLPFVPTGTLHAAHKGMMCCT